ncbi:MAG TPA: DMT family transporter, partial [Flavisolibacter sp.]|nr:DMT family transporter [Flavisolibacter sp.]
SVKGHHPLAVNFFTYLGLSMLSIPLALRVQWSALPAPFWIYALLGAVVGSLGNGLLVMALQKGDLSVLGPINAYKSVVGIIAGIFLLGEIPNWWGALGTLLIIGGSYFVLDTTEERFSWALLGRKEIKFRLWAMLLTAIEAVFVKRVILASDVLTSFLSWCWLGALFSFLLLLLTRKQQSMAVPAKMPNHLAPFIFLILCIGTMQLTTLYVFDHMPVGYALALFQLSTIVSVLLGHHIFNERDIRKKLLGAAIMMIGSVVIILLKD